MSVTDLATGASPATTGRGPLPWEEGTPLPPAPSHLEQLADRILERCRGEGPANCVGQCPLHVDARSYVQLAKEGRFQEGLQKVREQLPFPGVLGYVCVHPCELHCKRIDEDSAVRIRDIKRFLAEKEEGEPRHILDREPDRGRRVAVVGGGPAGLLAAHDLARRGYGVTVLEKEERIGGCLRYRIPEYRLPQRVVDRDLSIIDALGIEVRTGAALGRDVSLAELREEYDAVLLLVGYAGGQFLLHEEAGEFSETVRETLRADPLTLETGLDGVFAGGDAVTGPSSVIGSLALGRRAAESAHRYLSGEDLRQGRDSPLPPRLLWSHEITEEERLARERTPRMLTRCAEPMSEAEVLEDAERCLDCECGLCVKDCEFLTKFCDSPKQLARQIKERPLDTDVLEMTYSCNICSLCSAVCPEDLDTGEMLIEARRQAVAAGKGPLKVHKGIVSYWKAGVSDWLTMVMPEPGKSRAKRLFFTGCALPAVAPRHTLAIYDVLRRAYPDSGVLQMCCGAPVEMLGMEREQQQTKEKLLRFVESVGAEEINPACPDCTHTLVAMLPGMKVRPVWELLVDHWQPPRKREGETVSIHDSCKARHFPQLHEAVRKLIEAGGAQIEDVEYKRELARCCGFGGMIYPVDSVLSQKVSRRRAEESSYPMVTYCAGCRMALRGCGKDSVHLLDLLFSDDLQADLQRKPPGALGRYLNRWLTKRRLSRLQPMER